MFTDHAPAGMWPHGLHSCLMTMEAAVETIIGTAVETAIDTAIETIIGSAIETAIETVIGMDIETMP